MLLGDYKSIGKSNIKAKLSSAIRLSKGLLIRKVLDIREYYLGK